MPRKVTKAAKVKNQVKVSKSDLIRDMAVRNSGVGPTEIANKILAEHEVKVSPAMVSTVLSQDRARGSKPVRRGRPPADPIAVRTDEALDIPKDIQKEKIRDRREIVENMGRVLFGDSHGVPLTAGLFTRMCAHRRERAMELLMQAASAAGGIDELSKLFDGLKALISPKIYGEQKSA